MIRNWTTQQRETSRDGGMERSIQRQTATNDVVKGVVAIGRSRQYELLIVGKGRFPPAVAEKLAEVDAETAELRPMGGLLASSGQGMVPFVLVIQQRQVEVKVPKQIWDKDAAVGRPFNLYI